MQANEVDHHDGIEGLEHVRRRLTWALVGLFALVVVLPLAAVGLGRAPGPITAVLQLVLPSIVALMVMVLRFYFSERADRRKGESSVSR